MPAIYANRIGIRINGDGIVTLAFGERDESGADQYHATVALVLSDAEALCNSLLGTIAQHKAKPAIDTAGENVKPIR